MTIIETIRLICLDNAEHTFFHKRIFKTLAEANLPELQLAMSLYQNCLVREDGLNNKTIRSTDTDRLTEINDERTRAITSLWHQLKCCEAGWDTEKAETARKLLIVYRNFRRDFRGNRGRRTEGIVQFLQEMGDKNYTGDPDEDASTATLSADAQLLGLQPWILRLKSLNQEYERINERRNDKHNTLVLQGNTGLVRRETDQMYRHAINMLKMLISLNGINNYEHLVGKLNVIIVEFRSTLKLRETVAKRRRKKKAAAQNAPAENAPQPASKA